jgi:hypothetical protein
MPIQLTDQALVAVEITRRLAARTGEAPTVAHLVAGLASEPDGVAAKLLATTGGAPIALALRADLPPLPPLDDALRQARPWDQGVPVWTLDLLQSALRVDGEGVDVVLGDAGYDTGKLRGRLDLPEWRAGAAWLLSMRVAGYEDAEPADPETRGLAPAGTGPLTAPAGLAVARARALRGRARDVALALQAARERGWPPPDLLVSLQMARQHHADNPPAGTVVDAALDRQDPPIDCAALARATIGVLYGWN